MRARVILLRILLTLLAGAPAHAQRFYPDDPLLKEPPPLRVEDANRRRVNDMYDLFQKLLGKPGAKHPRQGPPVRALSINTLDEVPDNSWFTNRIGSRPMTVEELTRLPEDARSPAEGPWTITGAKTEGITPGFRIRDSRGNAYFLKFDPLANPEMATAADVIGAFIFRALGYNVPTNHLVIFDPDRLVISEEATIPGGPGRPRPLSQEDVYAALFNVPRRPDGQIRAVASQMIPGRHLGEFRHGTRADDPNDLIPHEHRREVRGLHVIAAWLNHNDARAINTFDTLVEEGDLKYIKHYLIDFGSILGSASVRADTAREGNAYFFELKPALAQIFTLGLYVPPWARAHHVRTPALGSLNWEDFDPEKWKPNYPQAAFRNRLPDDNFWAAKKVMAFTEEHIRAIARQAQHSNPADEELIVRYLLERQRRIGRTYFAQMLPLDAFRVENGELRFEDLAVKHGFDAPRAFSVQWFRFDNAAETKAILAGETGFSLPATWATAPQSSYFLAEISEAGKGKKQVHVYVRKEGNAARVICIERTG